MDNKRYLKKESRVTPLPEIMVHSNPTYVGNAGIQDNDPCNMEIQDLEDSTLGFANMNYKPYDEADETCDDNYKRLFKRPNDQIA